MYCSSAHGLSGICRARIRAKDKVPRRSMSAHCRGHPQTLRLHASEAAWSLIGFLDPGVTYGNTLQSEGRRPMVEVELLVVTS